MDNRSPIQELPNVIEGCQLFIKRDDLLPFSFGGNKYRIAQEFFQDMEENGYDCIIGYGNIRSNMCRAISNIAKSKNIPCYIISPEEVNDATLTHTNNSLIVELCDAIVYKCKKTEVAETVESVINECKSQGLNPYYVNGNKFGHGNEKTQLKAYYKVYKEIESQSMELGVKFDYIFLTTGTGMTTAGLIAGKMSEKKKKKIVGLSIARDKEKEERIIRNLIDVFYDYKCSQKKDVEVDDSCLCGGYGCYNEEIIKTTEVMMVNYGLPLDVTYTGKAFTAMKKYIKRNGINGNILFIHTGGTPLFFDNLKLLVRNE